MKIEHYWVRFEFASSQGQIHAHLLAISPKSMMQQQYFDNKKSQKTSQGFMELGKENVWIDCIFAKRSIRIPNTTM